MIVGRADLKRHLRVDDDEQDDLITAYEGAAAQQVSHWIGRPVYGPDDVMPAPGADGYNPYQMRADNTIRVAIMQLVDRMFEDRHGEGGASEDAVPPMSVRAILAAHRVFDCPSEVSNESR